MERRQLEYFLAVSEHGGFSSAARALHVAQPSLSHAIGALENEVGGALFHRLPNGVVLTPAGEALVRPAQQVARDLATASASVREVLGLAGGHLDIAAQTSLAVDPLATMVGAFLERHPRVMVRVTGPEASSVGHLVRSGAYELGLAGSNVPDDLDGVDLRRQELELVLPPGSPSVGDEPLTHAELAACAFVVPPPGTASRGLLESAAHGVGVELRIAVETAHRAMLVPLVLAGVGAALLPRSMASDAAAKGAVVRRASPALSVPARLMWRRGPLSPAAASFVDQVRVGSP